MDHGRPYGAAWPLGSSDLDSPPGRVLASYLSVVTESDFVDEFCAHRRALRLRGEILGFENTDFTDYDIIFDDDVAPVDNTHQEIDSEANVLVEYVHQCDNDITLSSDLEQDIDDLSAFMHMPSSSWTQRIFAHIYGLQRTTYHGHVHWTPRARRLQDVAHITGCPAEDVIDLHRVAVTLHGEPLSAQVFISQLQDDLHPPRTACLVVFEIIKDVHHGLNRDSQYQRKDTQPWFPDETGDDPGGSGCSVDLAESVSDVLEPAQEDSEPEPEEYLSDYDSQEDEREANWGSPLESDQEHEDHYVSFLTWYIHHQARPLCERPRLARVRHDDGDWTRNFAEVWADYFVPGQSARVSLVQPQPHEQFGYGPPKPMHLLIEQGIHGHRTAIIVSNDPSLVQPHPFQVFALSVPHYATGPAIISAAGLTDTCARRGACFCLHGQRQLSDTDGNDIPSGALINVHIATRPVPESPEEENDETASLQTNLSLNCHSELLTALGHGPIVFRIGEDDVTAPQVIRQVDRDGPPPEDDEEDEEDQAQDPPNIVYAALDALWEQDVAHRTDENMAVIHVLTYFLDGHRHTTCTDPRSLRLGSDRSQWPAQIFQLWADRLDPWHIRDIDIHRVTPDPPDYDLERFAGHFIVTQHLQGDHCAWQLSSMHGPTRPLHRAVCGDRLATRHRILMAADLGPLCYRRAHFYTCQVMSGGMIFSTSTNKRTTHGNAFVVQVRDEPQYPVPLPPVTTLDTVLHLNEHSESNLATLRQYCDRWHNPFDDQWIQVKTWFVHHNRQLRCKSYRLALLTSDPDTWLTDLEELWSDVLDPQDDWRIHWVQPQPPHDREDPYTGHLILEQGLPTPDPRCAIFVASQVGWDLVHQAVSIVTPVTAEMLIWYQGLSDDCAPGRRGFDCTVRLGDTLLTPGVPIRPQPGQCYDILGLPRGGDDTEDDHAMLQMGLLRAPVSVRPKVGLVAHTQLPEQVSTPRTVLLADHIPAQSMSMADPSGVYILDMQGSPLISEFYEGPNPEAFAQSLCRDRGYTTAALAVPGLPIFVLPHSSFGASDLQYYLYVEVESHAPDAAFIGPPHGLVVRWAKTRIEHMRFLYTCGFWRAVVLPDMASHHGLHIVRFVNNKPTIADQGKKLRQPAEWATEQPRCCLTKSFPPRTYSSTATQQVLLHGLSDKDLDTFFDGSLGEICRTLEGIQLPSATLQPFADLSPMPALADLDRIVIYTDGSSRPDCRGKPPLQVEEEGHADTSAFLAIGEQYATSTRPHRLSLIGWAAHPVIYDPDHPFHAYADHVGSDVAEREAVLWASLWRLRLNNNIPTCFRSDSSTTAQQAAGTIGAGDISQSYRLLRAVSQTLRVLLPGDLLRHEHVHSHCGEPWNELVDALASQEAAKSFHLPRPSNGYQQIRPFLPYMWMIFGERHGMPVLGPSGFNVPPIALPATQCHDFDSGPDEWHSFDIVSSFISANVNSLSSGPDGHTGKVDFLREQFLYSSANFFGLQETRSASGSSFVKQVLRLCSGASQGQGGVELWSPMRTRTS
eukprot:Skav234613  [mRNA]  locus=scaffold1110:444201:449062:- [translate_table: standard]